MLERIREGSQGVVAKAILVLVILTFALAGIGSYIGGSTEVASVIINGETITKAQVDNEFAKERANLERQYGEMFKMIANNPSYMERVRQSVLERLIAKKLIDQTASEMDLRVGDEQIKQTIRDMKEFHIDGQFNNDRYLSLVRSSGYRVEQFRELLREDLTRSQLIDAVIGSDFVLNNEALTISALEQQLRDIRYLEIKTADFTAKAEVSPQEINDYYDLNSGQFMTSEQLSLEYVELKVTDLVAQVTVDDAQIDTHYNDNTSQYTTQEQRRVSHILFELGDDEVGAKQKALAALTRVKAGEDFAALAQELSEDTFSGEEGGDLDWMTHDNNDDEFSKAAFSLNKGEISELVLTESGFHIIKVTDVIAQSTQPLSEVRADITAELQLFAAKELFYELQQQLADSAFSMPDNLVEAAQSIEASVKTTALFTRQTLPAGVNYPQVLDVAFSEQVIGENLNSDVIEISPDHHMVIRKKQYIPSEIQAVELVKDQITSILKQQKSIDMAKDKAEQYLVSWNNNEAIDTTAIVETTDVLRSNRDIDNAIISAAFSQHKGESRAATLVKTQQGHAIVELIAVKEAEKSVENLDPLIKRLTSLTSNATYQSFIGALKAKSDIQYPAS